MNTKPFYLNSFLGLKGAVYYETVATVIFSRVKITCYFHMKISSFRAKAHLAFHWCLYNKNTYLQYKSLKLRDIAIYNKSLMTL